MFSKLNHRSGYEGDIPILVIGFLRSEALRNLLESLPISQKKVYISIDGPRNNREKALVDASIEVAQKFQLIRSATHVEIKTNPRNLGCKYGIFSAIDWAFENEESLIILEDDIVITKEFLDFAGWGLKKYQFSKEIWQINGWSPLSVEDGISEPYLSIFAYGWGWATWKDRWNLIELELEKYDSSDVRDLQGLKHVKLSPSFNKWWSDKLNRCNAGLDTWDYQWNFSMWIHAGFSLSPSLSLTGNVGFDELATHTKIPHNNRDKMPSDSHRFMVSDYFEPELNAKADKICAKVNMGINKSIPTRIRIRLKRYLHKRGKID
jgi:GR25 family glycosyltransferase involved in LPS biosynthesis